MPRHSGYVFEPSNITETGLTLLQINPKCAADLRKDSSYFGWLFFQHPDGHWVTLRSLNNEEIDEAQDQASNNMVLDLHRVRISKSGVRFS